MNNYIIFISKKAILFFTLVALSTSIGISQNYKIIESDCIYYFNNLNATYVVKVDSIELQVLEQHLYHFSMLRDTIPPLSGCIDLYGGSLLGEENILINDSLFYIFTFLGDTVTILPQALLNEEWIFYKFDNGSYIKAVVTSIVFQSVFSELDSVKSITLEVKDSLGNDITTHLMHHKVILLSKSHGLVQTLDFYMFPTDATYYFLEGTQNPDFGFVLSPKTIFDYSEGDEFHFIRKLANYVNSPYGYVIENGEIETIIKKIISKSFVNSDSAITYYFNSCSRLITYTNQIPDTTYTQVTLSETINFYNLNNDSVFFMYPWQTYISSTTNYFYPHLILRQYKNNSMNFRSERVYFDREDIAYEDSCWTWILTDPQPNSFRYIEGCGGPFYSIFDWFHESIDEFELVYYTKGVETWGNPVAPSCESLINLENEYNNFQIEINVYPNPTFEFLFIESSGLNCQQYELNVIDINGKSIYSIILFANITEKISLKNLSAGFYFIQIHTDNFKYYTKIIKI